MKIDQTPPKQSLQDLLDHLKIKSIQDLFSTDQFNIDSIAKTTNNHKIIVCQHLNSIQKIFTRPYNFQPQVSIRLEPIFRRWNEGSLVGDGSSDEVKWTVNSNNVVEIIGRTNGGKSHFLNEILIQCLKAGQKVIYLDSNRNIDKLAYRIDKEIKAQTLHGESIWLKHLEYRTMSDLCMLLHCLGNELTKTTEIYFIFIDCIGRSEEPQAESNQSPNTMEYKFVDKFKRLLLEVSHLGGIIYASRCGNLNTLFHQTYRTDKHRPKFVGLTTKHWDNIPIKTFCVDYTRTTEDREHWRLMSTKSINYKPLNFSRKCK